VASQPLDQSGTPVTTDLAGPTGKARFGGGWIGYLGFPAADGLLPIPQSGEPRRFPSCWFGYYDHVLRRDRASGRWSFEALVMPGRERLLEQRLAELCRRAGTPGPGKEAFTCSTFRLIPSPEEHKVAIREAVRHIRRGSRARPALRGVLDVPGGARTRPRTS
jgi:anthranilate/para-aminobenzoate synthase component I